MHPQNDLKLPKRRCVDVRGQNEYAICSVLSHWKEWDYAFTIRSFYQNSSKT